MDKDLKRDLLGVSGLDPFATPRGGNRNQMFASHIDQPKASDQGLRDLLNRELGPNTILDDLAPKKKKGTTFEDILGSLDRLKSSVSIPIETYVIGFKMEGKKTTYYCEEERSDFGTTDRYLTLLQESAKLYGTLEAARIDVDFLLHSYVRIDEPNPTNSWESWLTLLLDTVPSDATGILRNIKTIEPGIYPLILGPNLLTQKAHEPTPPAGDTDDRRPCSSS
jgi:hypothetical protein